MAHFVVTLACSKRSETGLHVWESPLSSRLLHPTTVPIFLLSNCIILWNQSNSSLSLIIFLCNTFLICLLSDSGWQGVWWRKPFLWVWGMLLHIHFWGILYTKSICFLYYLDVLFCDLPHNLQQNFIDPKAWQLLPPDNKRLSTLQLCSCWSPRAVLQCCQRGLLWSVPPFGALQIVLCWAKLQMYLKPGMLACDTACLSLSTLSGLHWWTEEIQV